MTILRPEEVKTFPPIHDLTPDELALAYRLAKAAFTPHDLQKYADIDDGVPASKVLADLEASQQSAGDASSLNGLACQYTVTMTPQAEAGLHDLHRLAVEADSGAAFRGAFRKIIQNLSSEPLAFGNALYRLPARQQQLRHAIVSPLVVDFAVHEHQRLVYIRGLKVLSGEPGPEPVQPERSHVLRRAGNKPWPQDRELTPEELQEVYALASATFTTDGLQQYFELDEGVPFEEVLAELEEMQRAHDQRTL